MEWENISHLEVGWSTECEMLQRILWNHVKSPAMLRLHLPWKGNAVYAKDSKWEQSNLYTTIWQNKYDDGW